jgi:hydrophobic/amphiphilic exporter-1 (mainly G- bacteria), HAE1 family
LRWSVAVVSGLCVSQLLTLFITPVIYIYLDRIDHCLKRRLEPQFDEAENAERPRVVAAEQDWRGFRHLV